MPVKKDLKEINCSLAQALAVVGDWWSLLVMRDVFLGNRRFNEIKRSLGIASNMLHRRLDDLVAAGVVTRDDSDGRPSYGLSARGMALVPPLIGILQWGDAEFAPDGPPIIFVDGRGRRLARIRLENEDGEPVDPAQLRPTVGPGANQQTRAAFAAKAAARPAAKS